MSDTPAPQPRSHLALVISLCVNLLLAGIIAIPLVRFAMHGPMFGQHMHDALGPSPEREQMHHMLSPRALMFAAPAKTGQIKTILKSHHEQVMQLRTAAMAARRKVIDTFSAPQFDKAAFDKALADMQAADGAFESEILKVVSESASLLSPEERLKAAEFHGPPMMGGHGHGWNWHHDRDSMNGPPPGGPGDKPPPD